MSPSHARNASLLMRPGRHTLLLGLSLLVTLSCGGSESPTSAAPPPTGQIEPKHEAAKTVASPSPAVSIVRPEKDASRTLQLAKNTILGVHVPTGFVLRTKRPGAVFGAVYTYEKNLTQFYQDQGYHVTRHERGYKFMPSPKVLAQLSEANRKLARETAIYSAPTRARWWSLQILSRHIEATAKAVDPMSYIHHGQESGATGTGKTDGVAANPVRKGGVPYVYRRYKKPRNTIDLRPKLREWVKTNPGRNFLD